MKGPRLTDEIELITRDLFEELREEAERSPRRRKNHNFHRSLSENPNRLLNLLLEGSYIAPHRHLRPPKPEAFLVLEGGLAFFLFDDGGRVTSRHLLGEGERALGIDVRPGVWHALAAVSPHALLYEVKPGPYEAGSDKEFAPWAPREGEAGAAAYLESLLAGIAPRRRAGG
jgi:cupin fold WbuC family metalloprotein